MPGFTPVAGSPSWPVRSCCSVGSLVGGYWLAERLSGSDSERRARETLEEMKRGSASAPAPKYARIEDLPDLPKYTEVEPGQPRPTLEEKPRPKVQLAAAASSAETWRKNAVPFRDLNSKPLVAIVIDDVGLDRPRSKRAWELPGPLTMSFLPYAKDLREQAKAARARGHAAGRIVGKKVLKFVGAVTSLKTTSQLLETFCSILPFLRHSNVVLAILKGSM